jgi:hypothetical protein
MNKRGQVTVFVILGIVILAAVFFVFYFLGDNLVERTNQKVDIEVQPLKTYVQDCLEKISEEALDLIGRQGGVTDPVNYRLYDGDKVNYLCHTPLDLALCNNLYPDLKGNIITEVNEYVELRLKQCVDISLFEDAGYKIEEGEIKVNTEIFYEKTVIEVEYPLTITKQDVTVKENDFKVEIDNGLGRILSVVKDIVESETTVGYFENLLYMVAVRGEVEIEKQVRDDTMIYIINNWQSDYKFKFAVRNLVR